MAGGRKSLSVGKPDLVNQQQIRRNRSPGG
jgi:hypothetical protein